ncbi:MAG: hypothetical protein KAV87_68425 [Desulfobacteraceae bacterium]|nr:hypothetical protein [Desulfobacteraceae bacterium]
MNNKINPETSLLRSKGIILIKFIFLFLCLSPALSFAANAKHWITLAENACIPEESYKVSRKTDIYHEAFDKSKNAIVKKLIRKGSTRLGYTKKTGLKPLPPKKVESKTSTPPEPSVFTVDVGHMLQKMKEKAQWVLENENESLNKQACVILSSSGDKWLVRLWIRKKDGAVLRYDQYLNNKFLGTSVIEYGEPRKGKYFPVRTNTRFNLTNDIITQQYYDYSFVKP